MEKEEKREYFEFHKWTLFTFALIIVVGTIGIAGFSEEVVDFLYDTNDIITKQLNISVII